MAKSIDQKILPFMPKLNSCRQSRHKLVFFYAMFFFEKNFAQMYIVRLDIVPNDNRFLRTEF